MNTQKDLAAISLDSFYDESCYLNLINEIFSLARQKGIKFLKQNGFVDEIYCAEIRHDDRPSYFKYFRYHLIEDIARQTKRIRCGFDGWFSNLNRLIVNDKEELEDLYMLLLRMPDLEETNLHK